MPNRQSRNYIHLRDVGKNAYSNSKEGKKTRHSPYYKMVPTIKIHYKNNFNLYLSKIYEAITLIKQKQAT